MAGAIDSQSALRLALTSFGTALITGLGGGEAVRIGQKLMVERASRHRVRAASIHSYLDTVPVEERRQDRVLPLKGEARAQSLVYNRST